jgi:hypothetical protein
MNALNALIGQLDARRSPSADIRCLSGRRCTTSSTGRSYAVPVQSTVTTRMTDGGGHLDGMCALWLITRSRDYETAKFKGPHDALDSCAGAIRALGSRLARGLYEPTMARGFDGVEEDYACVDPLSDWVPDSAPRSDDNWKGVNRSVDVPRLAGHRVAAHGCAALEAIRLADNMALPAR